MGWGEGLGDVVGWGMGLVDPGFFSLVLKILSRSPLFFLPPKSQQSISETGSHRRDNRKNSPTQTPKGDYNTNLLDPSTLRNRR